MRTKFDIKVFISVHTLYVFLEYPLSGMFKVKITYK